jgi:hypothetical protein
VGGHVTASPLHEEQRIHRGYEEVFLVPGDWWHPGPPEVGAPLDLSLGRVERQQRPLAIHHEQLAVDEAQGNVNISGARGPFLSAAARMYRVDLASGLISRGVDQCR